MSCDLPRLLPKVGEFSHVAVPVELRNSFTDAVKEEIIRNQAKSPPTEFNMKSTADWESFFDTIGDSKPPTTAPVRKAVIRRSLGSSSISSSRTGSFSMGSEEFPPILLNENADRINTLVREMDLLIDSINNVDVEKKAFQRMVDELEESVNKWKKKTDVLMEKAKDQPNYKNADHFLSPEAKAGLASAEVLLKSLKAKKGMETQLGETVPDPEVTAESMAHIKTLVAKFISDSKNP